MEELGNETTSALLSTREGNQLTLRKPLHVLAVVADHNYMGDLSHKRLAISTPAPVPRGLLT